MFLPASTSEPSPRISFWPANTLDISAARNWSGYDGLLTRNYETKLENVSVFAGCAQRHNEGLSVFSLRARTPYRVLCRTTARHCLLQYAINCDDGVWSLICFLVREASRMKVQNKTDQVQWNLLDVCSRLKAKIEKEHLCPSLSSIYDVWSLMSGVRRHNEQAHTTVQENDKLEGWDCSYWFARYQSRMRASHLSHNTAAGNLLSLCK